MAEHKVEVKMSRFDNSPWGFRVHGGADFGCALTIQKVNLRSLGEAAGLQGGDVIFLVNGQDISLLKHKEAQEAIKQAGNNFVLTIGRDGVEPEVAPPAPKPIQPQQTFSPIPKQPLSPPQQWQPDVKPVGQMPKQPSQPGQNFTQTSLTANVPEEDHYEHKHNIAAKGFNASPVSKVNGNSNNNSSQQPVPPQTAHHALNYPNAMGPQKLGPSLPTKQYNSPKHMYSDEAIQEIMAQQAEVLAGGVKGIDFNKKTSPTPTPGDINPNSATLKMVLDMDQRKPQSQHEISGLNPTAQHPSGASDSVPTQRCPGLAKSNVQSASFNMLQRALEADEDLSQFHGSAKAPRDQEELSDQAQGFKAVSAPVSKPRPEGEAAPTGPPLNTCAQCDRLITGVFCKVQGKPLHGECFVCKTCSAPLKNVGYYSVNDKLYCEPHARAAKASENVSQRIPMNTQAQKPAKQQQQEQQPTEQEMKEEWDRLLSQNQTGAANNAEDFTKGFMADMFGKMAGLKQQPQQPQQPQQQPQQQQRNVQQVNTNGRAAAPKPQVQERQNQEWNQVLNQNKTGSATNAEDFTKQFMSEMFGNGAQTPQNQMPLKKN